MAFANIIYIYSTTLVFRRKTFQTHVRALTDTFKTQNGMCI